MFGGLQYALRFEGRMSDQTYAYWKEVWHKRVNGKRYEEVKELRRLLARTNPNTTVAIASKEAGMAVTGDLCREFERTMDTAAEQELFLQLERDAKARTTKAHVDHVSSLSDRELSF